jgi:hypothetical protein
VGVSPIYRLELFQHFPLVAGKREWETHANQHTHTERAEFTAAAPRMAGPKRLKGILDEAYVARLSTHDMLKKIAHEHPFATFDDVLDALKSRQKEIAAARHFLTRAEQGDKEARALLVSLKRRRESR